MPIMPEKLKKGDTVAVISPSSSLAIIGKNERITALKKFKELGLNVIFSKHVEETDDFASSSIKSRVEDLHWAFSNKAKAISWRMMKKRAPTLSIEICNH